MYKRPESILVVIVSDNGETLLLCRQRPASFWQSVTGSLDSSETPAAAARRELFEETGLSADGRLHATGVTAEYEIFPEWRHRYAPGTRRNREHQFVLRVARPAPVQLCRHEHRAYAWVSLAEAVRRTGSVSNREALLMYSQSQDRRPLRGSDSRN